MKNKLVIYETSHFENLPALLVLSENYFSEITIFLPIHSQVQLQYILQSVPLSLKINWVTQQDEHNRAFIRKLFQHIHRFSYTHLHIGTLEHNMFLFAWHLRKCRDMQVSITIHSLNEYKHSSFNGIRAISETIAKKLLHRQIRHHRVLAPAMVNSFKKLFPSKQVCFIPGSFYKGGGTQSNQKKFFTLVIPGTVSPKRRDYQMVIKFFSAHGDSLVKQSPIRIILAGNAGSSYGREVATALQQLARKDLMEFTFFQRLIDQMDYVTLYEQADVIWAPVVINTKSIRDVDEINAVTHSPGFITDQIYFGKPAIIPKTLQVPQQFLDSNWRYETEADLLNIFSDLLSNTSILQNAGQKVETACAYFNQHNFKSAFRDLIAPDE